MNLSDKILKCRRQLKLSQEELANKLYISRQAVSRWENGTALPDAQNILQLSRLFGVSTDYLLNDNLDEPDSVEAPAKPKKKLSVLQIVLLALGSPIWVSLLIACAATLLSLYISLWAIIVSLWAVFGALIGSGLGGLICGAYFIFSGSTLNGAAVLGLSLVCFGLAIFMFYGCRALSKRTIILTKKAVLLIKSRFTKGDAL